MSSTDRGSVDEYDVFVDGEFRVSQGNDSIDASFPYDGGVWASVPDATKTDVDDAVDAGRDAFERGEWGNTHPSERRVILNQIADTISRLITDSEELKRLLLTSFDGMNEPDIYQYLCPLV